LNVPKKVHFEINLEKLTFIDNYNFIVVIQSLLHLVSNFHCAKNNCKKKRKTITFKQTRRQKKLGHSQMTTNKREMIFSHGV
jgi:hypothetical protein